MSELGIAGVAIAGLGVIGTLVGVLIWRLRREDQVRETATKLAKALFDESSRMLELERALDERDVAIKELERDIEREMATRKVVEEQRDEMLTQLGKEPSSPARSLARAVNRELRRIAQLSQAGRATTEGSDGEEEVHEASAGRPDGDSGDS